MRLSGPALASLPASIEKPTYDRRQLTPGIVHLGVGAFHRAHQAVYTDDVLARDPHWGIVGASLRSPDTRDALAPQDGLYALAIRSAEGERLRVIGAVIDVLVASGEREKLLATMADPRVRIVSLTVTEKGYCHDPATGKLDENHPDVIRDLQTPHAPVSAPGLIVESLRRRRAAGIEPFTVVSCDNLPSNGRVAKSILDRFAHLRDRDLGAFVEAELLCPSTMVDRITPATTDEDRKRISDLLGVEDAWPVVTEPFSQWVLEDRFTLGRPAWEEAGAELVGDVEPYEHMKLRLLNGSHSTIAYLGYLAGYQTVAAAVSDSEVERFIREMMDDEISPTLAVAPGMDLPSYKAALLQRFRNPALKHRTWQIAMDGSQKLPQRLLGTVRDRLRAGAPFPRLALGVAGWMRYVAGSDEQGAEIDVRDPLVGRLRQLADAAGPVADRLAPALMGVEEVFGSELPNDPRFREAVTSALARLLAQGARQAIVDVNASAV